LYHPKEEPSLIKINSDRVQYWLGVGAQPTEQVMALLKLTGDFQASKGEKAVNKVQVKDAKVEFVIDAKKKPVLLPKEEKKAKAEVVAEEAPVASEEPSAEVVEEVAAEAAVAEEVAVEEVAAEEAPAEEAAAEEAPVAEAEAPAEEA
jgi:small subunit ribosomal protein S16